MSQPPGSGVYRHHTILTATRAGTETFQAVDEMPAVLRATCLKVLDGQDTATLIIADQRGLEAWHTVQQRTRQAQAACAAEPQRGAGRPRRLRLPDRVSVRLLLELLFCCAAGLAIWLLAAR